MKEKLIKKAVILAVILLSGSQLVAIDWGFKLGMSRIGYSFSDKSFPAEFESRSEFIIGAFIDYQISKNVSIQTEFYFPVVRGMNFFDNQKWLFKHKIYYLEIPVLLKYKLSIQSQSTPEVFFGAYYANQIASDTINIWDNWHDYMIDHQDNLEDAIQNYDYGLVFGGSIELDTCFATLIVDVRYSLGLANILKDGQAYAHKIRLSGAFGENKNLRNRAFLILFGLSF